MTLAYPSAPFELAIVEGPAGSGTLIKGVTQVELHLETDVVATSEHSNDCWKRLMGGSGARHCVMLVCGLLLDDSTRLQIQSLSIDDVERRWVLTRAGQVLADGMFFATQAKLSFAHADQPVYSLRLTSSGSVTFGGGNGQS